MTAPVPFPVPLLVADADREATADRLRRAAGEGRLTLLETDDRLATAYAARTQAELDVLVADLPVPPVPPPTRRELVPHAAVVAVLSGLLVLAWARSGAEGPWFLWPVLWLVLSLVAHAQQRGPWRVDGSRRALPG